MMHFAAGALKRTTSVEGYWSSPVWHYPPFLYFFKSWTALSCLCINSLKNIIFEFPVFSFLRIMMHSQSPNALLLSLCLKNRQISRDSPKRPLNFFVYFSVFHYHLCMFWPGMKFYKFHIFADHFMFKVKEYQRFFEGSHEQLIRIKRRLTETKHWHFKQVKSESGSSISWSKPCWTDVCFHQSGPFVELVFPLLAKHCYYNSFQVKWTLIISDRYETFFNS